MSIIAWLFDFIHARRWLVELLILLAVAGLIYAGCQHLIGVGVQRQKDADALELAAAIADRDKLAAERQANAERRSAELASTLDAKQAELDEIRKHLPTHAVKHDETSTDPCPPLRLDTDWVRAYQAASDGSVSTVLHP